jgi:hypothetical protein
MTIKVLNDYVGYRNVEVVTPKGTLILLDGNSTVKKIVAYIADEIKDIKIGDEIITGRTYAFPWEHAGETVFFIKREQVEAIIYREEKPDEFKGG